MPTGRGLAEAVPIGIRTVNVVPTPTVLSTAIVPWCAFTRSDTSDSPMPAPSWPREIIPGTRWNRSKILASSSGGMPIPVSATTSTASSPSSRSETRIEPTEVNFTALDSRLATIRTHISGSTSTRRDSVAGSTSSRIPARSIAARNMLATSAVTSARSVGSSTACSSSASAWANASRPSTSRCSRSAPRSAMSTSSRYARPSCRIARSEPRISVSGVRSSWLTFWRNRVLAASSATSSSARWRCDSYASASVSAVDTAPATDRQNARYSSSSSRYGFRPSVSAPATSPLDRLRSGRIIASSGRASPSTDGSTTAPNEALIPPTTSAFPDVTTRQPGMPPSGPGMTDQSRTVPGSTPNDPTRWRKRRESSSRRASANGTSIRLCPMTPTAIRTACWALTVSALESSPSPCNRPSRRSASTCRVVSMAATSSPLIRFPSRTGLHENVQ